MDKPLFVFTGLLDSGKTRAIKSSLQDPNINAGGSNLIISFEQGEEEYDELFLSATNSSVVYLKNLEEFTYPLMADLDFTYNPSRIFVELNGRFNDADFYNRHFIKGWMIAQVICFVDGENFKLYLNNFREFLVNHVNSCDVCVVNRIDNIDTRYIRNNLKAINKQVQIIYEDANGNIAPVSSEELFDTSKPLDILNDDYGIWYMDALENPDKYNNCRISFNLKVMEIIKEKQLVIIGRNSMVCCEDDMQGINLTAINLDIDKLIVGNFYHFTGVIQTIIDHQGQKTCILDGIDAQPIEKLADELVYFN